MKQVLIISLLVLSSALAGQKNQKNYLQGFEKEVSGLSIGYHSALPDANVSLLMRGRSDSIYLAVQSASLRRSRKFYSQPEWGTLCKLQKFKEKRKGNRY